MRSIALDIHRDFCEVAIDEGGEVRSRGRIIAEAKVKTDKVDARTLCELLDAGSLPAVWRPDEHTRPSARCSGGGSGWCARGPEPRTPSTRRWGATSRAARR